MTGQGRRHREIDSKLLDAVLSDESYRALLWHATGKPKSHDLWKAVRAVEALREKGERA